MSAPVGDQATYGNKIVNLDYSMEIEVETKAVEMSMKALYLIRGLPNTGKSSIGYILLELYQAAGRTCAMIETNDFVYHPEDVTEEQERFGKYIYEQEQNERCHELCLEKSIQAMRDEQVEAVIVCSTFTEHQDLKHYLDAAKEFGRAVFVLGVENLHGKDNGRGVDLNAISKMSDRFQSFQLHPKLFCKPASNQSNAAEQVSIQTPA